jgi:hypothetical protein
MANINAVKTDLNKEENGTWIEFALGIRLKIARARNPRYQERLRELTDPHRKDIREDKADLKQMAKILKKVRAETILLDWENIEDESGQPIPYSSEKALEFFNDNELKDFYSFVVLSSEQIDNFKKDLVEESEKN